MLPELNDNDWSTIFGDEEAGVCTWQGPVCVPAKERETNLEEVHKVLDQHGITRSSVKSIVGIQQGEQDERNWILLAELNDGRYLFVSAGCDYTGWD